MQILLLLIFLLPSASGADLWPFGGGGGNATKIRGVNVKTSLGCTDGQILKYVSANSQFECANDAGGVGSGDVGGGPSLTTAGAGLYVLSNSTIGQDTSWTRVAAGQYTLYNATGPNALIVRAGSSQSSTNPLEIRDNSGTAYVYADNANASLNAFAFRLGTGSSGLWGPAVLWQQSTGVIAWSSTSNATATKDLGLARSPSIANTLLITNGSSTNYWGIGAGGIQCLSGDGNSAACDVGTTGARVRDVNAARNITAAGNITGNNLASANVGAIFWSARAQMTSPADGQILLRNSDGTDFSLLQFGGTTSSFPAEKRSGTNIEFKLADDSAYTAAVMSETYLGGAAGTDGTWKLTVSGGSLLIQKRESGSYVTKSTIAP